MLTRARANDVGLGDELAWLVAHLRADLSGEFLRAMVDNLRSGLEPELCVVRSLRETVAASAALIDFGVQDG